MLFERAVVMGGSMAGLLAARVLAEYASEVVIVDRDQFPVQPEFRSGVPQARHAHALLRYPGTEGERKFAHRLAYAYMDRLFIRSAREPAVRLALIHVFGMTKPPTHLFRLPLAFRALTTSIPPTLVRPQHALAQKPLAPG
ncbi:MAG TPA: hypothetical protein VFV99_05925 [Kofleriaceae bacterium]|nr:hypothetical protein [Kofleriaceae bacterium]